MDTGRLSQKGGGGEACAKFVASHISRQANYKQNSNNHS